MSNLVREAAEYAAKYRYNCATLPTPRFLAVRLSIPEAVARLGIQLVVRRYGS